MDAHFPGFKGNVDEFKSAVRSFVLDLIWLMKHLKLVYNFIWKILIIKVHLENSKMHSRHIKKLI